MTIGPAFPAGFLFAAGACRECPVKSVQIWTTSDRDDSLNSLNVPARLLEVCADK